MASDFEATNGPLVEVPVSADQISRLEDAIEGELDGLAITREQAISILRHVLAPSVENHSVPSAKEPKQGFSADINSAGDNWITVTLTGPGASDLKEAEIAKALNDLTKPYTVGDRTMKAVFEPNGLRNLYDMQAVFDAIENALAPTPDTKVEGVIAAFERAYELDWHVAKGKLTADEPLYGAAIFTDGNTEMGHGESDVSAEDAFRIALEDAGLSLSAIATEDE